MRQKTVSEAEQEKTRALIRDLGASSFNVREKATNELIARGAAAVGLLSQAVNDPDPEIASLVKRCLAAIDKKPDPAVPAAVVRLLALRKSAGAAEALLAYLRSARNDGVADQVRAALTVLAFPDGKPDEALVRALEDKDPIRREAARSALGRDGKTAPARPGQRLLLPGYNHAMKVALHRNGKKLMEWEVTELELFNKLDPQVLRYSRSLGTGEIVLPTDDRR